MKQRAVRAADPVRVARVQALRRSNAATSIPSGKRYKRRPKHRGSMVKWNCKTEGEETQT